MSIFSTLGTEHCLRSIQETAARARKLELKTDHATVKGVVVSIFWQDTVSGLTDTMEVRGDARIMFTQTGWTIRAYAVNVEITSKTHRLHFQDYAAFKFIEDHRNPGTFGGFVMPSSIVITDVEEPAEAYYILPESVVGKTPTGVLLYGHVEACRIDRIESEPAKEKLPKLPDQPKERDSFCHPPEALRKVAAFMQWYWREYSQLGNYKTRFPLFKNNPRFNDTRIQTDEQFKAAVLRARSAISPDPDTGRPYLEPMHRRKSGKNRIKASQQGK